jgi:acyl-coenzyme A thioesterase PaaI-like protein
MTDPNRTTPPSVPDDTAARERLGGVLRRLGHHVVGHHIPTDSLNALATQLETALDELPTSGARARSIESFGRNFQEHPLDGDVLTSYIDRPFCGSASPWSIDPVIHREGDEVVARFQLGPAHEGAPGRSHGGIVAGAFDDILGFVLSITRTMAYTGQLTVRYEAGVPLHQEIEIRARAVGHEGRKLFITADAWHDGHRLATAEAIFITVELA